MQPDGDGQGGIWGGPTESGKRRGWEGPWRGPPQPQVAPPFQQEQYESAGFGHGGPPPRFQHPDRRGMNHGLLAWVTERQNTEDTMIPEDNKYYQCQGSAEEMDDKLVSLKCRNIVESKETPTFGYDTTRQHIVASEDQDGDANVNVGPSHHVITNQSSFNTCREEIIACAHALDNAILNKDKDLKNIQAEIQCMMEEKEEKDNEINSIVQDIMKDLQASDEIFKILKHDKMKMIYTLQQLKQKLKETTDAFQKYKNTISAESGVSALDAVGMWYVEPTLQPAHQVQGSSTGAGLG